MIPNDRVRVINDLSIAYNKLGTVCGYQTDEGLIPVVMDDGATEFYFQPNELALEFVRFTLKDSGDREKFVTGSQRDTREGKGRYDLLPPEAIRRLALVYENGAKKYDDRNWEKGQPLSRLLDSALRHGFAVLAGMKDEDHAAQAAWNFFAFITISERIERGELPADLDDLGWCNVARD